MIVPLIWTNDRILGMVILASTLLLLVKKRNALGKKQFFVLLSLHIAALAGWTAFMCGLVPETLPKFFRINYAMDAVYFLLVSVETVLLFWGNKLKMCTLLLLWISAPLVMLPMAAISTLGPRNYFTSDYFMIVFCACIHVELLCCCNERYVKYAAIGSCAVLLAVCIRFSVAYSAIGAVTDKRMELIESSRSGEIEELVLPDYPYLEYLWLPEPNTENRIDEFKEFYGIPESVVMRLKK